MAHVPGLPGWTKKFIEDCDAHTTGHLSARDQQRVRSLFPKVVRVPLEGRDLDELVYVEVHESPDPRMYRVLVGYEDVRVHANARRGPFRREVDVEILDRIQVAIAPEWVRVSVQQNDVPGAVRIYGDIDADDLTERLEQSWNAPDVAALRLALCTFFWAADGRSVPAGTTAANTMDSLFLTAAATVLPTRQRKGALALIDMGWTESSSELWEAASQAEDLITQAAASTKVAAPEQPVLIGA